MIIGALTDYIMTLEFKTCSKEFVEDTIAKQPEGKNTRFLNAAHSLWFRFKNYENNPPYVLIDGEPVAFIFATLSKRTRYVNLYEIVTVEGKEGRGYASEIWDRFVEAAYNQGMERIKLSCTPSSITWHARNGLIFWAVDPSGSCRSDQPLFPNRQEQATFRELALKDPSIAFPPDSKIRNQLMDESLESHGFGKKKTETIQAAIASVGEYWMRDALLKDHNTLEAFF